MKMHENEVLAHLSRHYRSALSRRALWTWSGGDETDIDFDLSPEEGWSQLWGKADRAAAPTRVGLVREMLHDAPGETCLLDYLAAQAEERFKAEKATAEIFFLLLNKTDWDENRLAGLLFLFQDMTPDCILSITAPTMQTTRADRLCADLEQTLPGLGTGPVTLSTAMLIGWLEIYLDCLAENGSKNSEFSKQVKQAREHLGVLSDMDPEADEAVPDTALGDLIVAVESLSSAPGIEFWEPVIAVTSAVARLLPECDVRKDAFTIQLTGAGPIQSALWGTR